MSKIILLIAAVIALLMLPSIFTKRNIPHYSDNQLRQIALSRGMKPIPKNYSEYLQVIDNSQNQLTKEKIILGKELFFDKNLSKNRDVSCATCHMLSKSRNKHILLHSLENSTTLTNCASCHIKDESGTDRLSSAVGTGNVQNPLHLNTMTILNSSLAKYLTWDGTVHSVEEEAGNSLQSKYKMNMTPKALEKRISSSTQYVKKFNLAFENNSTLKQNNVSFKNMQLALGTYVRTLLTRGPYDRFLEGDNNAISKKAKRGFSDFIALGCKGCHTGMSVGGQVIERFPLKAYVNVNDIDFNFPLMLSDNSFPFKNTGGFLGKDNKHYFRVPILRNVTKTSPYFHNGSVAKIEDAVRIMGHNQIGVNLTDAEVEDIVAFLKTLEGNVVDYTKDSK